MMKIRIRNFQSIADATLEVEGLTVITGRTNLGKSAAIRAIKAMLFGALGEHFIRRGSEWVGGAVQMDGPKPLKIVWRKVNSKSRKPNLQPVIEINGVKNTKIGRDHKALTAPYGLSEIVTSVSRLLPQVAMQHDEIFLVSANETVAAEVFKMLGRVDVITEAQRLAKRDLGGVLDKSKIRDQDRLAAQASAEELEYLKPLRPELEALRLGVVVADTMKRKAETAKALTLSLGKVQSRQLPAPLATLEIPATSTIRLLRQLKAYAPKVLPAAIELKQASAVELMKRGGLQLLKQLLDKQELYKADHADIQHQLFQLEVAKADLEKQLKICPTCERPFDDAHNHAG